MFSRRVLAHGLLKEGTLFLGLVMMILSSDELDILHYLRGWNGKFITLMEISRRAGGRRRYEESPNWPNGLMTRLVEAALIEVNERGHYRLLENEDYFPPGTAIAPVTEATEAMIVDEDYFP